VSIVLGRNFVLTFQERATGAFEAVRERLRAEHGAMRAHGPDYLAYALLDTLVDRYFVMLDNLSDMAEDLEDEALSNPNPALLAEINRVKHEALVLRRAIWPLREVLNTLSRADNGFFTPTPGSTCGTSTTTPCMCSNPSSRCATCSPTCSTSTCPASATASTPRCASSPC
jgi:Mg2+ and Co2+ transporter CorA